MRTRAYGSEGSGVGADKVVVGGLVVVLDVEAEEGELGRAEAELPAHVPHRVEAWVVEARRWRAGGREGKKGGTVVADDGCAEGVSVVGDATMDVDLHVRVDDV